MNEIETLPENMWQRTIQLSFFQHSMVLILFQNESVCTELTESADTRWSNRRYGFAWWRHQMETFSALLALCLGNSLVTGEFPSQRPVTRSFDVFFDLRLNKRLSKQSRRRWLETPSRSLWRHCNGVYFLYDISILLLCHMGELLSHPYSFTIHLCHTDGYALSYGWDVKPYVWDDKSHYAIRMKSFVWDR